jgi:hypothetical protein
MPSIQMETLEARMLFAVNPMAEHPADNLVAHVNAAAAVAPVVRTMLLDAELELEATKVELFKTRGIAEGYLTRINELEATHAPAPEPTPEPSPEPTPEPTPELPPAGEEDPEVVVAAMATTVHRVMPTLVMPTSIDKIAAGEKITAAALKTLLDAKGEGVFFQRGGVYDIDNAIDMRGEFAYLGAYGDPSLPNPVLNFVNPNHKDDGIRMRGNRQWVENLTLARPGAKLNNGIAIDGTNCVARANGAAGPDFKYFMHARAVPKFVDGKFVSLSFVAKNAWMIYSHVPVVDGYHTYTDPFVDGYVIGWNRCDNSLYEHCSRNYGENGWIVENDYSNPPDTVNGVLQYKSALSVRRGKNVLVEHNRFGFAGDGSDINLGPLDAGNGKEDYANIGVDYKTTRVENLVYRDNAHKGIHYFRLHHGLKNFLFRELTFTGTSAKQSIFSVAGYSSDYQRPVASGRIELVTATGGNRFIDGPTGSINYLNRGSTWNGAKV